jgi:hypothetical protein
MIQMHDGQSYADTSFTGTPFVHSMFAEESRSENPLTPVSIGFTEKRPPTASSRGEAKPR